MLAQSMEKKRKFMIFLKMLFQTVLVVGLMVILTSCGTSPGYNYAISGTVSGMLGSGLVLQNNGGDDRSITANGSFSFSTALTSGTAYAVTVKTQPTNPSQTCTIINGNGSMNEAPVGNVRVSCLINSNPVTVDPFGKFAYVSNISSTDIASYTIDSTGALTSITGATAGTRPNPVTVDPSGKFAYVSNIGDSITSGTISVYTIDSTTGILSPGTTVDVGKYPTAVTVDPSGQFAYVANMGSNNISVFTIESDGALTPGTTIATENNPTSVTIDSLTKFAYVPNMGSGSISVYTIDSTGALTPGTAVAAGTSPTSVTIYADSEEVAKFAYAANMSSGSISVYTIGTDGSLSLSTVTPSVAAGTYPMSVTVDPLKKFAYVSNMGSSNISVYTIDTTTGALTAGTTMVAGTSPNPVKIIKIGDPAQEFAYVSNMSSTGSILVYSIDQTTGTLTLLQTVPIGTSLTPVTIDPNGPFAYVSNASTGTVFAYAIKTDDGTLTPVP